MTVDDARAPAASTRRLSAPAAFRFVAVVVVLFLAATAAVSPLYAVYQERWGFSPVTLTAVFAIYAVALLGALLLAGGLSDSLGRRPLLVAALVVELASLGCFLVADRVAWLLVARVLQGAATGVAQATTGAALLDLVPASRRPTASLVSNAAATSGLGVGALGSALLVRFAPAPTHLVFVVLAVMLVLALAGAALLPETVPPDGRPRWRPRPQVGVPPRARAAFLASAPCIVALWALGGLYLSLGPSLANRLAGPGTHLAGGVVIFVLNLTATACTVLFRDAASATAMRRGCLVLVAGVVASLAGVAAGSVAGLVAGTAVAGCGFGVAFLGAYRTVVATAEPAERGRLIAAVFVLSYSSFSLPALAAGAAVGRYGLERAAIGYGVAVVVLALASVALGARLAGRPVGTSTA